MNKLNILKFSLISLIFSIVAVVMHLLPSADLMFIKDNNNTAYDKQKCRKPEKKNPNPV